MQPEDLHIFFFPLLARGHLLPMVDMAELFAERGVRASVVTTPANAALVRCSTGRVQLLEVQFSSSVAGLPDGCENVSDLGLPETEVFFKALGLLRHPFEELVRQHRPDCILSDMYYPWTADVASTWGIPRISFGGTNAFSFAALGAVMRTRAHQCDGEAFVVPGLPHRIEVRRSQIPDFDATRRELHSEIGLAQMKTYGTVVNSFLELEPDYAAMNVGVKTWHVGPVSLCNRDAAHKAARGGGGEADDSCLGWLDTQKPGSVVYVCFGSLCRFTREQLREMAVGLEASGHPFLWVVRPGAETTSQDAPAHPPSQAALGWLPVGFEERTRGRGMVHAGWAPQILVLDHPAVGGFMTHCGWNSCLEAIAAGVPMVTWPLMDDQFFNEKLLAEVLQVGVSVGIELCRQDEKERELVAHGRVREAVAQLMGGGPGAEARRERVRELGAMARAAMQPGGSSFQSLSSLVDDLIQLKRKRTGAVDPPSESVACATAN